ncbi:GNAT family N-acetyltransferase [Kiloniella laminariae]|uniref:GNAT family N-acetyltransferase n=1 Tax=Kiloniella laminariae TaxID=454162 RepID=A0ABT4LFG0_9PROT|nr:GNAT family N-acetyltransferase [Kiloniella laminariae]MCZ4279842.1 GNAT family N-acetyltransferase [Kiloniella laminariae]
MPDYRINSDLDQMDLDVIHGFISQSYWAKGIPRDLLERALGNSLCFGLFDGGNNQIGFARMITDRATFAYLADVFVLESHRGRGLGKLLMQAIVDHPELQGLRRMMLATRDAHDLYAQYGFTPIPNPEILMQNLNPTVYG